MAGVAKSQSMNAMGSSWCQTMFHGPGSPWHMISSGRERWFRRIVGDRVVEASEKLDDGDESLVAMQHVGPLAVERDVPFDERQHLAASIVEAECPRASRRTPSFSRWSEHVVHCRRRLARRAPHRVADAHHGRVHRSAPQHLLSRHASRGSRFRSRRSRRTAAGAPATRRRGSSAPSQFPIGSAVQSESTTQWKSRNIASRTVESTHTLVVAPTKTWSRHRRLAVSPRDRCRRSRCSGSCRSRCRRRLRRQLLDDVRVPGVADQDRLGCPSGA